MVVFVSSAYEYTPHQYFKYSHPVPMYYGRHAYNWSRSMPHSPAEKKRVLGRVNRVRGQLDALQTALEQGAECGPVLQQIAALRGAVNGLMAGVLESHLREEFSNLTDTSETQRSSIDEVVSLVRTYLK
jgi:DNA-binding FrmR family transcriptional regulator